MIKRVFNIIIQCEHEDYNKICHMAEAWNKNGKFLDVIDSINKLFGKGSKTQINSAINVIQQPQEINIKLENQNKEDLSNELYKCYDTSIYFEPTYLYPPTCQYNEIDTVLTLLKNDFQNVDSNIYYSKVRKPSFKLTSQDKITKNKDLINTLFVKSQCDLCGLRYFEEELGDHKAQHVNRSAKYLGGSEYREYMLSIDDFESYKVIYDTKLVGVNIINESSGEEEEEEEEETVNNGIVKESLVDDPEPKCTYCGGDFNKQWNQTYEENVF